MKNGLRLLTLIATMVLFASLSGGCMAAEELSTSSHTESEEYVCPPCGCGQDQTVFTKEGTCPSCGMRLVLKSSLANQPAQQGQQMQRKKAAILIFNGVQIIDYTGPFEVFGQAGFEVYTVALSPQMIVTSMGMKVSPNYTFENCPKPDVIIIPGGNVNDAQENPQIIKWIQETSKDAQQVLSVCNGAFILARTGLLDGLSATTFYGLLDGLAAIAPKTKVVNDQRYVDNGKIITTAGLSSGIDGSLYVISKMLGHARAQMVALNMEYNWQPGSKYARASFADMALLGFFGRGYQFGVPDGVKVAVKSTEGGTEKWEVTWQAEGQITAAELLRSLDAKLTNDGKWRKQAGEKSSDTTKSAWNFTDQRGREWDGISSVQQVAGEKNKYLLTLKIARNPKRSEAQAKKVAFDNEAPVPTPAVLRLKPGENKEQAAAKQYVCPPCGCASDSEVYDKPGTCPSCGMALIEKREGSVSYSHLPDTTSITVKSAWVLEAPPAQHIASAYMVIENQSSSAITLTSAASEVAAAVELHTMENSNGLMRMRRLDQVAVPAKDRVEFKPGGLHLMLIGLKREIRAGEEITVTLVFSDSTKRTVTMPVKNVSAAGTEL